MASRAGLLCACVLILIAALSPPAAAEEPAGGELDARPALLGDEWYSEGWDQIFYFSDGSLLVSQITILNIGFGSHHAGVFAMLLHPDGERTIIKQSRSNREWEFSDTELDLAVAEHRLGGRPPDYRVLIKQKSGEIDLAFHSVAEAWPIGRTLEAGDGYQYVSFYAPLAEAAGRYSLGREESESREWRSLANGRGFAVRYVNSIGLHELLRTSTRIVDLEHAAISPVINVTVDDEGAESAHVALFGGGRLLHQSEDFELTSGSRIESADDDSRSIPDAFRIDVKEDDFTLSGTIEIQRFLARVDPVESLKPLVRAIVKLLNTPIQYRYLVAYDLDYGVDGTRTRLRGRALMDHMVLRHERSRADRATNTR